MNPIPCGAVERGEFRSVRATAARSATARSVGPCKGEGGLLPYGAITPIDFRTVHSPIARSATARSVGRFTSEGGLLRMARRGVR
jgi:hypothetical protein